MYEFRRRRNRLNCADLIVHIHERDQYRVLPDGSFQIRKRNFSGPIDRQNSHRKVLFFQKAHGFEHRRVFDRTRDEMPPVALSTARVPRIARLSDSVRPK